MYYHGYLVHAHLTIAPFQFLIAVLMVLLYY